MTVPVDDAKQLLIVGMRATQTHIGGSLARAADRLGVKHAFVEAGRAFTAPRLIRMVSWRLAGHRPRPGCDGLSEVQPLPLPAGAPAGC